MSEIHAAQRIDLWLWHGRFYKTRTLATKMVRGGKVRLNGNICKKPSTMIKIGDVLTFVRVDKIFIVKIIKVAARRGPAPHAQTLYQDLTPKIEKAAQTKPEIVASRPSGSGRPTKNQRRAIDKLMSRD